MTLDLFLISASVTLLVLSAILISMFVLLNRSLEALTGLMKEFRGEVVPVIRDLRIITVNAALVSDSVRATVHRFSKMSEVVEDIGDDLEAGRRSVKGGVKLLAGLISSWLVKRKA